MRCYRRVVALVLCCFGLMLTGAIASPADHLRVILAKYHTFSAKFVEKTYTDKGQLLAETTGQFWLRRPNQFRWLASQPSEQVIIGDGRFIWIYNVDLMQVTKQPQHQQNTPIQLLLGDPAQLLRFYRVSEKRLSPDDVSFVFVAKDKTAVFQQVSMRFEHGFLQELGLDNTLGQHSQFRFLSAKLNEAVAPSVFRFTPPKGVDVINHDLP